uniref:C2H2-type domain-containing protein n=1 Tax=Timema tahoe TaxID=61484 RepID=A0A7R9IU96_9NEOP|nr:unnamed protein product [Timema tahoe]
MTSRAYSAGRAKLFNHAGTKGCTGAKRGTTALNILGQGSKHITQGVPRYLYWKSKSLRISWVDLATSMLKTTTATLTRKTPGVSLKNYHCLSCNTSSLSLSELKKHNLNHHNSINLCNSTQQPTNTTSSSSIKKQAGMNSSSSYPCVQCDKSFKNQYLLQRHNAAIHSSNKCNVCGKHFNKLIDYKVHMKRFVDTKHFACDHCNATFKDKLQMTRHEQIHTDDKRYMCRFCDYSAYYVTRINTHERKHTGNYRHRCEVCNKEFGITHYIRTQCRTSQVRFLRKILHLKI